jgi:hypothetical protein
MKFNPRRKLVVAAIALALCSFAGGAYAATQDSRPAATSKAFLNDVARRLGVTPQRLTAALDGAITDQLNAAVKAGKLTQAQANMIEQRMEQGGFSPLRFFGGPGGFGLAGPRFGPRRLGFQGGPAPVIGAIAKYLGISTTELRSELRSGESLKQIAKAHGKSVEGLGKAVRPAISGQWHGPMFGPGGGPRFRSRSGSGASGRFGPGGGGPGAAGVPGALFAPAGPSGQSPAS